MNHSTNFPLLSLIVAALLSASGCQTPRQTTTAEGQAEITIAIACTHGKKGFELCRTGAQAWSEKSGHKVKIIDTPRWASRILERYQRTLSARSPGLDVLQIDVIWPGFLHDHLLDLTPYLGDGAKTHFPALVANNTVDGRLVAMPWYVDAGLLYYRKDLLEKYGATPPETWQQLAQVARRIQDAERSAGNAEMWGYVWQGRAYEGLTCDALEWIASHNGGVIVEPDGRISIDNPNAVRALNMAAGWVGTISPKDVLRYTEEESRSVFTGGRAVFLRNWPYVWNLVQDPSSPIRGQVGLAALPKGGENGRHVSTAGGWQLAVSKYSRHPEIAADLVKYLTGAEEQKRRAIEGRFIPTVKSLYQDPELLAAWPVIGDLYGISASAVPRPATVTGPKYHLISAAFHQAVHDVLSGRGRAEQGLAQLESELRRIKGGGWR